MTSRSEHRRLMEERIFDAAIRRFDDRGYDATSVEEICADADVGRATFFRYYETKTALIRELDRRIALRARERLDQSAPLTFAQSLSTVVDTLCETWLPSGSGLRGLGAASPTLGHQERQVFAHVLDVVVDLVAQAQHSGEVHTELPTRLIAYLIVVQLLAPVSWWINNPGTDLRSLIEVALHHCLIGYLATTPVS